ncbi:ATP-grasp domain-containing protein [Streptomyces sp. 6N223]|uniref:ATP-grasp domain-containing protein n=1 Tax=Streptomyces sp. 6N223 TaxID=3457412 RepID=UPI003FD0B67B
MKLGVFAWARGEIESVEIAEHASARGHDTTLFASDDIGCMAVPNGTVPTIAGTPATEFDVVLSRANVGYENWRDTSEQLQLLSGVPGLLMLDPVETHLRVVSKFAMLHRLTEAGIPVPETRSCRSLEDFHAAREDWGSVVLKPSVGFYGTDVERFVGELTDVDTKKVEEMLGQYGVLICQRYIPHEGDLRVLIVNGKPAFTALFGTHGELWKPFPGHETGIPWDIDVKLIDPSPGVVDIAVRATEAMELSYAGVDVIRVDDGFVVVEVNVVPGWEPMPRHIRQIPTRHVVDLIEERYAAFRATRP